MPISESFLDKLYENASTHKKHSNKAQALTTIIEVKQNNPTLQNYHNSIYLDTKLMLSYYIQSRNGKEFGYDQLDCNFIKNHIEKHYLSDKQQISLYEKAAVGLKSMGEDSEWIRDRMLNIKLRIFKKENWFKYLIVLSGKSKLNCVLTLLFLFVIECLFLLPVADEDKALFAIKEESYSENPIINHMTNVLALRLDWIEGPELFCLSWLGVLLVVFWVMVYLTFVANILFKNLFEKIDIYEISE